MFHRESDCIAVPFVFRRASPFDLHFPLLYCEVDCNRQVHKNYAQKSLRQGHFHVFEWQGHGLKLWEVH